MDPIPPPMNNAEKLQLFTAFHQHAKDADGATDALALAIRNMNHVSKYLPGTLGLKDKMREAKKHFRMLDTILHKVDGIVIDCMFDLDRYDPKSVSDDDDEDDLDSTIEVEKEDDEEEPLPKRTKVLPPKGIKRNI